jgi:hypothetical protein
MVQQASISYQERGTTTASVVDVFGGSHNDSPFTSDTAFFYGTTLYLLPGAKMNRIDPIPKQNLGMTGTFPTVWDPALPGYNIDYVHFIDAIHSTQLLQIHQAQSTSVPLTLEVQSLFSINHKSRVTLP